VRIAIQADDGDEVSIKADFVSVEQAVVTLEQDVGEECPGCVAWKRD